jgi:hypothetical protein
VIFQIDSILRGRNYMENPVRAVGKKNRRSFLKQSVVGVGAVGVGVSLLPTDLSAQNGPEKPTKGDIAILTFLSALEQVEADLWIQYAELGGVTTAVPGAEGNATADLELNGTPISTGLATNYVLALQQLDMDMPQYITDNTDDEISHHVFLNNYILSKGGKPIDLFAEGFGILNPSDVPGVPQRKRLTNLRDLTVSTSWWTRYRSGTGNPDLGDSFPDAVPDLAKGQHPAIPNQGDLGPSGGPIPNHLQAIANTAGFHFGFIEVGGTSLYPTLAQKVSNLEVLRVLLSIGPTEAMHFQTWQDKAGNAPNISDPSQNLSFPNLNTPTNADLLQTNLIMPEPTFFLNKSLGPVSIVRPTTDALNGAVAAVKGLTADGLFFDPVTSQNTGIVNRLLELAEEADAARRT